MRVCPPLSSELLLPLTGLGRRQALSMAKEEKSEMATIAKKQLEGRGYVLSLSTTRDGENLIGKVRVTEASTQRTVASFVSVWKIDNMELVFGIDAGEGIARDLVNQGKELEGVRKKILEYSRPLTDLRDRMPTRPVLPPSAPGR